MAVLGVIKGRSTWPLRRLSEAAEFLDHIRRPVSEVERRRRNGAKPQSDLYPYYGANGQAGWIDSYLFDEPLVLLAEDGGAFGSATRPIAYRVDGKAWVNNHAHVLRPRPGVDVDFLAYALAIRPDVVSLISGTTRAKLNQETAASITLPLPPLPQQRYVAAQLRAQLAAADHAKQCAQHRMDACEALALKPVWGFASRTLGMPVAKLSSVVQMPRSPSVASDGDIAVKTITSGCLAPAGFRIAGLGNSRMTAEAAEAGVVRVGEVLVARSNTEDLVGRAARFPGAAESLVASDLIFRLVADAAELMPDFLAFHLSGLQLTGYWRHRSSGASSTMKKITKALLLELNVPKPPLADQRRIVAKVQKDLEFAEVARVGANAQLEAARAIPASLLRRAFADLEA